MAHANEQAIKKPLRYAILMVVVGTLLACTAGCHSSDDASGDSNIPNIGNTVAEDVENLPPQLD